ncbi:hypothetical protein GCM10029992_43920 [Glycomyces albus]
MAVNLIAAAGVDRAFEVLASSFAQFQFDAEAVHIAEQARAVARKSAEEAEGASCDRGDFLAYYELTQSLAQAERRAQKRRKAPGATRPAAPSPSCASATWCGSRAASGSAGRCSCAGPATPRPAMTRAGRS